MTMRCRTAIRADHQPHPSERQIEHRQVGAGVEPFPIEMPEEELVVEAQDLALGVEEGHGVAQPPGGMGADEAHGHIGPVPAGLLAEQVEDLLQRAGLGAMISLQGVEVVSGISALRQQDEVRPVASGLLHALQRPLQGLLGPLQPEGLQLHTGDPKAGHFHLLRCFLCVESPIHPSAVL
jgi:hypothetical protein